MLRHDQVRPATVDRLGALVVDGLLERRSTWTVWNARAEAARVTRGLRMASTGDRVALLDRVTAAALARSASLEPVDPVPVVEGFTRPDGTSVFSRPDEHRYTDPRLLAAEGRLLDAHATLGAPTVPEHIAHRLATTPQPPARRGDRPIRLAEDQVHAVLETCTSGRAVDVLVGPAGTGKTTTLVAIRAAWETVHGRGTVVGLAPSATAAAELAAALAIPCENTAKWLHEADGAGAAHRAAVTTGLRAALPAAAAAGDYPRVRQLRTAIAVLDRDQSGYRFQPDQLVIVDEASLAATLDLDRLRAHAQSAGAKLLLVGDHHQLSAVGAGGAFGLLAQTGRPAQLHSLWRFTHRWEAHATRRLRTGDPTVLDEYATHGRITDGPAETILDAAYTAWQADTDTGQAALLIAADNPTVTALNQRAHTDRVATGQVVGPTVPLGDETTGGVRGHAGAGDRILTRRNHRGLRLPDGGHVRNGALWTVTTVHPDGALTVTPTRHGIAAQPEEPGSVTLPASYVREHVDPGYATTAHRAQGVTVDTAHILTTPAMAREALYVAMTRGRHANHLYVPTDTVDPDCDGIPDPQPAPTARQVLTTILATSRRELSATETTTQAADQATSLSRLVPIRDALTAAHDRHTWQRLAPAIGLTPEQTQHVLDSPAAGLLLTAIRHGHAAGHPMQRVLAQVIHDRALHPTTPPGTKSSTSLPSSTGASAPGWTTPPSPRPTALPAWMPPNGSPSSTRTSRSVTTTAHSLRPCGQSTPSSANASTPSPTRPGPWPHVRAGCLPSRPGWTARTAGTPSPYWPPHATSPAPPPAT